MQQLLTTSVGPLDRSLVPRDGRQSNKAFPFPSDVGIAVDRFTVVLSTRNLSSPGRDNVAVLNRL